MAVEQKNQAGKQTETEVAISNKEVGNSVIQRVDSLCQNGFTMPKDFNHTNAINAAMMMFNDIPNFGKCTKASVAETLFNMCVQGLDVSRKQAYLVPYGDKLTLQPSYFGSVLRVKRIYPDWHPHPRVIRQGDIFEYATDINTGMRKLVKHESSFENLDNDFVGGYLYLPTPSGEKDLYLMTKKQILAAWFKSKTGQAVHKLFDEKMISKTLINTGATIVINSTPSTDGNNTFAEDENQVEDIEYKEVHHEVVEEPIDISDISEPVEILRAEKESDDF